MSDEVEQLCMKVDQLREELMNYWVAYHDDHCVTNWPHADASRCFYPPPLVLGIKVS